MTRVLVIEDEPDAAELLAYNLQTAGFEPVVCSTGAEGLRVGKQTRPDAILLDLMLPDMPGMQVCRAMKSDPNTKDIPIIIVSARGEEIDRVVGFEVGADDYIVKPYSIRELILRIRRTLERRYANRENGDVLRIGMIRLELSSHRAWVGDEEVNLRATEFKLLVVLCENPVRVLTRERLRDLVWQRDSRVALRTVDAHVKRLRDRMGPAGAQIETVRGVGYRMADDHSDGSVTASTVSAALVANGDIV